MMKMIKESWKGILLSLLVAVPAWFFGRHFPVIGGAVTAIILGMVLEIFLGNRQEFKPGIRFVSKKVLQWAVILLGFGLNLNVVLKTGKQSLPIILCTISVSLLIAYVLHRVMRIPSNISTLVGVGSSICGGSAIAATAPVIEADDSEVAQAISVIFFFNVLAAVFFPMLGKAIGFDTHSGEAFGIFAGTAINDTSSVTAAASTWDSMWSLGSATLDKAVTVKLTRTLAIIPITLVLGILRAREKGQDGRKESTVKMRNIFPVFILYFIAASVITTLASSAGVPAAVFLPFKELSKFFIVLAMAAIGLNTDIVKLVKNGGKPIFLGACCWAGITAVSLLMQHAMRIW
jgi:uncharacterized integral membrane protein (TIGR00698 family)